MALSDLEAKIVNAGREFAARADGWVSTVLGLGGARDPLSTVHAVPSCPIDHQTLSSLWEDNGLARRVVSLVPDHAVGVGIELSDPRAERLACDLGLSARIVDAWTWGRLYGRGAIFLGFSDRLGCQDDPVAEAMIQPGDLAFLEVYDGREIAPATACGAEITHYYVGPRWVRVHRSRLVLFGGAKTPPSTLHFNSMRGDDSVLRSVYDVLRAEGTSWAAVGAAFSDLSQAVLAVKDLARLVANGGKDQVAARMQLIAMGRSAAKAVVIDAEAERFEHVGAANLSGVDPLLGRVAQRVAAYSGIPATVLLGTAPIGLNATGESDLRVWYATLANERARHERHVGRLAGIVARSAGVAEEVSVVWPPFWELTDSERAQVETSQATADQVRITSGVLDASEVRLYRWGGRTLEEIVTGEAEQPPTGNVDAFRRPLVGDTWVDTADGHRMEVTAIDDDAETIYYMDRDSTTPDLQQSWKIATFLERCRRSEAGPTA